jgi:hypothetical protein
LCFPRLQTLRKKIAHIHNLTVNIDTSPAALSQSVLTLKNIPDATQRRELIHAYARSISMIWLVVTPILFAGLILCAHNLVRDALLTWTDEADTAALFIRPYTLTRTIVKNPGKDKTAQTGDVEKGSEATPGGSDNGDVHDLDDGQDKKKEGEADGATVRDRGSLDKSEAKEGVKETV